MRDLHRRRLPRRAALAKPLRVAGVAADKLTVAPFRSSADSIGALLGGHVDVVSATAPLVMPQVAAGKLRVLASAARERGTGPQAQIKTWREQGVAADYVTYNGVTLAPGVNAEQIRFWENALRAVSQGKAWIAMVEKSGAYFGERDRRFRHRDRSGRLTRCARGIVDLRVVVSGL